ncbi:phage tail spike protein [Priestia megaterium]|uniref:phage tail spike protein n=1 Tax=Priestia megaterium TaxID=1404 RepID=UPI002D7FE3C7|nr:phage tail spike protein [Priestia megaterium]MEB4856082.1 phage tail spike protein [Priestia megaterium]
MIHILDYKTDNIVAFLEDQLEDAVHLRNMDLEETFRFEWPVNDTKAQYIAGRNRVVIPDDKTGYREFIINELDKDADSIIAYCSASFLDLKKQKIISPTTLTGQTVNTAANWVLSGTEWELGTTDYAGIRQITFEYMNAYDAILQVKETFGCEISFRVEIDGNEVVKRCVDLVTRLGKFDGKEITFGKDLSGIRRKVNYDSLVTSLVCIGPEKEDGTRLTVTVENEAARQRWCRDNGKHLVALYEPESSDQTMTIQKLTSLGLTELNKRIMGAIEYEVEKVTLDSILGLEHEKAFFADTIRIKDLHYVPPLYLEARVTEVERPILDVSEKTYKLGEFVEYTQDQVMDLN